MGNGEKGKKLEGWMAYMYKRLDGWMEYARDLEYLP